ncbi:acetamidase/formamidase family protein [Mediterraneibacter sp. NSJ-55]|uniref:Acetamidase/formamidase family protein n=1 Tax=Mediterraneibacter hominis TaxID=2763054 RepID=A0A923LKY7_9FIRM|nr:acetamidase/formamidase family protein [Mediterraneibacter hominis]MBC5689856.1 acetamidase/formamidase family protein [Mediterraneibacter hominis]
MVREMDIKYRIYIYDKNRKPAMYADSGDIIIFHAQDFVENRLTDEGILKSSIIKAGFICQPCNGDVYINNAEPGDTLKVTIEKIEITAEKGTIALFPPDFEVYGKYLDREETIKVPIKDGKAIFFGGRLELPVQPMIGAIAVCPADEIEDTVTPGTYGGNMDCKYITEGTSLYLPVAVPGALLNMGDAHAMQGDGEIFSALEVPSCITAKVELIKNRQEKWPILETEDKWYVIASAESMDEATKEAMETAYHFLVKRGGGYGKKEWIILLGMVGDIEVCNVVDPRVSIRLGIPKKIAEKIIF